MTAATITPTEKPARQHQGEYTLLLAKETESMSTNNVIVLKNPTITSMMFFEQK